MVLRTEVSPVAVLGLGRMIRDMTARRGMPMNGVVEWIAPVRNTAWVAACFGTVDR
jgi:hypothetical protein